MRYRNSILVVAVAAAGIFLARAELGPYLPGSAARFLSIDSAESKPSSEAGMTKGAAGHARGAVTVNATAAKAGALPVKRSSLGTIVPLASTALSSPLAGTVAQILVKDGAEIAAGTLLVQLDDRTINANIARDTAMLAKDQAALDEANTNLKRVTALSNDGAETRQQYDDAVAAAKQAEAAIGVDSATLAADKVALTQTQVRAPFDGKLGVILLSPGAYVAPGEDIVTLTQMKPVYAEFTLPETDLALARQALADGQLNVSISPTLSQDKTAGETGPIVFIDNAVDAPSGTFKMRARLDNANGTFWPGQSLRVTVTAGEQKDLVLVPTVSVQPQSDGAVCYVIRKDKTVEVRKVKVAFAVGDTTGIADGLKEGEIVVTEGQAGLVEGTPVEIVSAPVVAPETVAESGAGAIE